MRVRELTEAAAIMRASGAPVALWSVDCESFYRVMGRQLAEDAALCHGRAGRLSARLAVLLWLCG